MFGRIRASSSSPDCLDLERPSSKLLKHDSFSVYECTLLKLKLGSRQSQCSPIEILPTNVDFGRNSFSSCMDIDCTSENPVNFNEDFTPGEDLVNGNGDVCSSPDDSPTADDSTSTVNLRKRSSADWSIPYLFSKYKASKCHSSADEMLKAEIPLSNMDP